MVGTALCAFAHPTICELLRVACNEQYCAHACDKPTRRANHSKPCPALSRKNIPLNAVGQISDLTSPVSPNEGRLAIVTNVRWDAVDAKCAQDECA